MRIIWILPLPLCALVALVARAAFVAPGDGLPEPIPTRQTAFSIPFTLPAAAPSDQEPVEVRLLASIDNGVAWSVAGRVKPPQTSFTFRAPRDGEYWFLIQTIDRQGHIKPENARAPELRVIVDTLPPRLDLKAARNSAGEIVARWLAVDPLLKADTLKIEYQVAGESGWHPVQFEPPRDDPSRSTATGDAAWRPVGPGKAAVRAEIRDRAGNTAVTQTTVGDGLPATEGPALGSPAGPPTTVRPSVDKPTASDRHDLTASRKSSRHPAANPATESATASSPGSASWPADQMTYQPLGNAASTAVVARSPDRDTPRPNVQTTSGGSIYSRSARPPNSGPIESRINPAVTERVVAPPPPASIFAQGLPSGERPYMVNSRKFALECEIESVGPAGISKIEIWGTRDAGRTWASYAVEPSRQELVRVSVEGEGLYGFRVTVQDGNGFGGRPPRSGDLPELWVGVDLTKPVAKLTGIDLGAGEHAGELAIRWEASDAMLAARPVSLLFGERPDGPWSTIAAGLDNTGFYAWRFDNRVPDRVYLRLEVRDEAGNVGEFQTVDPITLDPSWPQGHLRTVRPMDDEAARVQVYHFYR